MIPSVFPALSPRFRMGLGLVLGMVSGAWSALPGAAADLAEELKNAPYKIVHETHREGNWELFQVDADGTHPVNLTRTPKLNELYPHVSPDGTKICFACDEGEGDAKVRNIYAMNMDGSGRQRLAANGRDPCWNPAGTGVVYLRGEFEQFTALDYASKGISVFDLATRTRRDHPNPDIHHLYNICCTPDGKWYVATVHAGMGYGHAILAVEADGKRVVDLKIPGCRPDVSLDGKKIAWGADDFTLCVADLDCRGPAPKVLNRRDVVRSEKPLEAYHVDWSPDGKYVAFSRGPKQKRLGLAPEMIGVQADGWNIWVADAAATNRWMQITTDGMSNKEPEWFTPKKGTP
jgi:Tol biopolymer transport system component